MGPFLVDPFQDLGAPVAFFPKRGEEVFQLSRAEVLKIRLFYGPVQYSNISRALKK